MLLLYTKHCSHSGNTVETKTTSHSSWIITSYRERQEFLKVIKSVYNMIADSEIKVGNVIHGSKGEGGRIYFR